RISLSRHSIEIAADVILAQSHSSLGPLRGSKPGGPERELCHDVHGHNGARSPRIRSRGFGAVWKGRVCGGKVLRERCYGAGARYFMQESPDHSPPASGFSEVDLDQVAGLSALVTLNQRVRGSSP